MSISACLAGDHMWADEMRALRALNIAGLEERPMSAGWLAVFALQRLSRDMRRGVPDG